MTYTCLRDQVAIVTGAGRGIGRAIGERLAREGVRVALFDVNADLVGELASQLSADHKPALALQVDVSNVQQVTAAVGQVCASLGTPDILVNNAGIFTAGRLLEVEIADWQRTLNVNLTGTFICSQAVARHLMDKGRGRIINIASIGGKIGFGFNHAYCASKSGVIGLTRVLALDLAPYGVTVNAVCPGTTETEMIHLVDQRTCECEGLELGTLLRDCTRNIPLGHLAAPEMVADLVAFLASSQSGHITGQAINVDGGMVMY